MSRDFEVAGDALTGIPFSRVRCNMVEVEECVLDEWIQCVNDVVSNERELANDGMRRAYVQYMRVMLDTMKAVKRGE